MNVTERLTSKVPAIGEKIDHTRIVSVIRLHGVIATSRSPLARGLLNLSGLEPVIAKAFAHDRLSAVALAVNSPGGAATQSALIAERIRELAADRDVPVLAFCEDVAASGGYWLACAGDEIYAHATSMVGSIGVLSSGFGLGGLIDKLGVERRLHTAGENKARLDPFSPERSEDVAWLHGMQEELHQEFADWVRFRRGGRLDSKAELFTGEVWTGKHAQAVGLLDGLGTLRGVVGERYPHARVVTAQPHKPLLARLGAGGGEMAARFSPPALLAASLESAIEALEARGHWSRFGL